MVEEVTVVRHGYDGAFVLLQMLLQPFYALCVQMVGRLVQEQDVGFLKQDSAQCHTATLSSGEVFHQGIVLGAVQGVHRPLQLAVQIPCVVLLHEFGQLALLFYQGCHLVVAHRFAELLVQLVVFVDKVCDFFHSLHDDFFHGFVFVQAWLLFQVSDGVTGGEMHLAFMGFVQSGYYLQQ